MDGSMFIGTWWSLVPPLLAIVLALVTKEVYSSLFIGVAMGALLYTGFHPWNAFVAFFDIMKNSINTGRYTADYLQCGNLPYLAWKKHMTAHILSCRRIRRYLALSLKATEEQVTLVM